MGPILGQKLAKLSIFDIVIDVKIDILAKNHQNRGVYPGKSFGFSDGLDFLEESRGFFGGFFEKIDPSVMG